MLRWNAEKVGNLTPIEIWLLIIARVVIGFALGVLSTRYFPRGGYLLDSPDPYRLWFGFSLACRVKNPIQGYGIHGDRLLR